MCPVVFSTKFNVNDLQCAQACKLVLVIGHLIVRQIWELDWRRPSLTGHVDWALQLWHMKQIYFHLTKTNTKVDF